MQEGLVGFALAGVALAGSPGPATLSLAATGAAFGARRGLGYLAGLVAGIVVVMAVTASGVAGLLLAVPGAAPVVGLLAAAYFVWLAWRIATAPPLDDETASRRRPSFAGGVFLQLVNPKAYAAMAALFSGFVLVGGQPALDALAKIGLLAAIIVAVNLAWLNAGAALTRCFRDPRTNRAINLGFAVLLLVSVGVALAL
ncbi:Threonine/homoserine/homoserine lactone efflux protein [Tistlia consotensis]|uniref:Threonine/homoserine/homoserine lactone efflux protein n=1 Tax=Tistlia consotensis USBA 355 TaxID=560819 RepID=A0A1Y6CPJ9_9PROT|nr:LysE family translocator [Tistlia consotensis]SMF67315.1 Threonine/homoserine/homoserine lactone efflux protein [Tistlia consotensis USBA 355]SNS00025.1 Threonine/homoserine/homoserine lactone efflux protein [Tistlia consotensis]